MGSVIGGVTSYLQYRKSKEQMARAEARQEKAERDAKALTPAEATNPEGGAESEAEMKRKRRGIQATFTARQSTPAASGTVGE